MTAYQKFPIGAPFNILMARDASASLTQIEEMAKQLNARMTTLDSLITRYQDGLKKLRVFPIILKKTLKPVLKKSIN